jgi:glycosyltransferase domain-containing protein
MAEISNNHTLILRTRNRPSWLMAALEGYLKFDYKGVLFVVDDSEGEALDRNKQSVKHFEKTNLTIRHLTGFSKGIELRHKRVTNSTLKALDLVETDFLTFTSDDDFFFPTLIEPAVAFLNINPDHAGVVGPEIQIWTDEDLRVLEKTPRWWHVYQEEDPLERFAHYCYSQSLAYYGIFRYDFILLMKQIDAKTGKPFTGGDSIMGSVCLDEEIQWNQLLISSGKIGELHSVPMNIRIIHKSPTRIENAKFNKNAYPNAFSHGTFIEMLDDRFPATLRHWVDEACTWMTLCGTRYSKDQVYDTVLRWNQKMLVQYQGLGPAYSSDAFSKNLRKLNSKKQLLKNFLNMIQGLIGGPLKFFLAWRIGSFLDLSSMFKTLWPMQVLHQRKILKSPEVRDYMDHFNSLEKDPLTRE